MRLMVYVESTYLRLTKTKVKSYSDVLRKTHHPLIFCFTYAKNAANRQDSICSKLRRSEPVLTNQKSNVTHQTDGKKKPIKGKLSIKRN